MKKITLILLFLLFTAASCSMPRLVKVEETPDPTATPRPTATQESILPTVAPVVETPVLSLEVLMEASFSEDDGSWTTGYWADNAAEGSIDNGRYFMSVRQPSYLIWSQASLDSKNVLMEVDAMLIAGSEENGHGFICRYIDVDNFYFLFIGNDGWFSIDKYVEGDYDNLISDWAPDDVIDPLSNYLEAKCSGSLLSITANGTLLAEVSDNSLATGDVGLFVRSYETDDITIAFDNFVVYAADGTDGPGIHPQEAFDEEVLVYSDDFEDESGSWILGDFEQSQVSIENGWLVYRLKTPYWVTWDVSDEVYAKDVRMQAFFSNDTAIRANQQGFICRYQDDDNYYAITFGNDGFLRLGMRVDGEWKFFVDEYGAEDFVDPAFNYVEASCIGNELILYVGGVMIAQASDPDYTFMSGDVGILVATFEETEVVISVDDFMVYSLD